MAEPEQDQEPQSVRDEWDRQLRRELDKDK
ncbi:hypothetical protein CLV63_113211 [Murinocardiopsis flavida]|uniref:Uncharacterized protein n=1 Tax=Murinocardiopsis flavida TaxID=645275 RepID=A0A2P8DFQ4_9ACTN|nr:hypothetical protein CLV63_1413 [Murinocardiopsis flavida]PSK96048.1 hypothetical protein CLV63_113211 [Murinocardiopsis flavida]